MVPCLRLKYEDIIEEGKSAIITEPTAIFIGTPNIITSIGTINTPPPNPTSVPTELIMIEMETSKRYCINSDKKIIPNEENQI